MLKYILIMILPYSISTWLVWQSKKLGTILPHGSMARHSTYIGLGIKIIYFAVLINLMFKHGWSYLISFPITWYVSGWLATFFERKLYMQSVMNILKDLVETYKYTNVNYALNLLDVPDWWFQLMPMDWKVEYMSIYEELKENA